MGKLKAAYMDHRGILPGMPGYNWDMTDACHDGLPHPESFYDFPEPDPDDGDACHSYHLYAVDSTCKSMTLSSRAHRVVVREIARLFHDAGVYMREAPDMYLDLQSLILDVQRSMTCVGCGCRGPWPERMCPGCATEHTTPRKEP